MEYPLKQAIFSTISYILIISLPEALNIPYSFLFIAKIQAFAKSSANVGDLN